MYQCEFNHKKTTSLIILEDHPPGRDYPNHGIINEELSNSLSSSFTLCIQPLWKDTDVFNQTEWRRMLSRLGSST